MFNIDQTLQTAERILCQMIRSEAAKVSLQILPFDCWICGKEVSLEECKIDERGRAVHERCYVAKILFENSSSLRKDQSININSHLTSKP